MSSLTKEEFDELKKGHLDIVERYMAEEGNIFSHLTIFGKQLSDGSTSIINVPIPSEFLQSESTKDKFTDIIVPKLGADLSKRFDILGVLWTAEAWVRVADKGDNHKNVIDNWKEIPVKKEVVIITVDSDFGQESIVYNIVRDNMSVGLDGLNQSVKLELDEQLCAEGISVGGRFTGLYKKLNKHD
jgi:hypothetical protein